MSDRIVVRGAREHNLKDLSLTLPKDKLIVLTGLSDSGKSTLAFDTLHNESRRQFLESMGLPPLRPGGRSTRRTRTSTSSYSSPQNDL